MTIRQLDERTHARLRGRAAKHGRSVEAEVRAIVDAAVGLPEQNILLSRSPRGRMGNMVTLSQRLALNSVDQR